jgi:hypothetical protein
MKGQNIIYALLLVTYIQQEKFLMISRKYCSEIKVNGMGIQMLRFADDIAIIAPDEIYLKRALERLGDILISNYKMKINRIKQKLWFAPKIMKILILKWMTTPKYQNSST